MPHYIFGVETPKFASPEARFRPELILFFLIGSFMALLPVAGLNHGSSIWAIVLGYVFLIMGMVGLFGANRLRGASVGGFLDKTTEGKTHRNGLALRIGIGDNLLIGLLPWWGDSK